MSTTTMNNKYCKLHCCFRDTCKKHHIIDNDEDKQKLQKLYDSLYNPMTDYETASTSFFAFNIERETPCFYGVLCRRYDCNCLHNCNYWFRVKMNEEWAKMQ